MIKSMTGYGKSEAVTRSGRFTVEIRTVNHRYFDLSSRIPNSLNQIEDRVKSYIHKYIKRGRVNFSLTHRRGKPGSCRASIDKEAAGRYYRMLRALNSSLGLKDSINLSHILNFPEVIVTEQEEYNALSIWPSLKKAIKKALVECDKMREKEGRAIYKDLSKRVKKISGQLAAISEKKDIIAGDTRRKIYSRVNELLKTAGCEPDRTRMETEIALIARQTDITEELTRAKSHIRALKEALASKGEAGRRIDFILQELHREINTLGAKAQDITISAIVIEIKGEIEKLREQAQNVE